MYFAFDRLKFVTHECMFYIYIYAYVYEYIFETHQDILSPLLTRAHSWSPCLLRTNSCLALSSKAGNLSMNSKAYLKVRAMLVLII